MSENYCISVGLDYRTDGSDHEVEINYWDSEDNEARGIAKGENFEDAANHSFMNILENLTPQPEEEEESLDEYVTELESWLSEVERSRDALLDENARLERRILDLQKQVADFYKPCEIGPDPEFIKTEKPKPKYDQKLEYSTSTKLNKEKDSIEHMLDLLQGLGLF